MRDKGWTILSVGVNRANQHDLMELGGDSGNAFYIEKEHVSFANKIQILQTYFYTFHTCLDRTRSNQIEPDRARSNQIGPDR